MSLSLRAMRYVQAAMRLGSISAAAEHLNVAPSAVATALGQAEDAFGVVLATRARAKGLSPTLAGRDVQRRIDDLLDRYDLMMSEVLNLQSDISGTLSIGYNAPMAPAFLPALATDLCAQHPGITFSFHDGDNTSVRNGLMSGQYDAILFVEELPSAQIETLPLIFAPTYCLCPADHPIAAQSVVSVARILQEPLVLLDRPAARAYYLELIEQVGAEYRIVAHANSTEMVRSLVAARAGVSLLSMRPGDAPAYSGGQTRCVPLDGPRHGVTLSLGFAPGPKRRLLRVFVDKCRDFFDGDASANLIVSGPSS